MGRIHRYQVIAGHFVDHRFDDPIRDVGKFVVDIIPVYPAKATPPAVGVTDKIQDVDLQVRYFHIGRMDATARVDKVRRLWI
jgi:hypothetical protein